MKYDLRTFDNEKKGKKNHEKNEENHEEPHLTFKRSRENG